MIHSQPFASASPFSQRPVSPPSSTAQLSSSMTEAASSTLGTTPSSSAISRTPGLQQSFGSGQNPSMFPSFNDTMSGSTDNSNSSSPPTSSPPSFISLPSKQAALPGASNSQPQSNASSSNILTHSLSASSFFPSGSFPFLPPSQYAQGSIINSISNNSTTSTNSISNTSTSNATTTSGKNPGISANSVAQPNNALPPSTSSGTSNFFPNSVSSMLEDASATSTQGLNAPNGLVALRVSNLPRDIQEREFNVLFTFAPEFVFSELLKSHSVLDDGLPSSIIGIGYFKSLNAASNAMSILTMNPLVFAPKEVFTRPNIPTSPYLIKCDIRTNRQHENIRAPGFQLNGSKSTNGLAAQQTQQHTSAPSVTGRSQQPSQATQGSHMKGISSRFVFPSGGNPGNMPLEMPPATFPDLYPEGGITPNGVFSPTSPRSIFPGEPEYLPRMTGKSLLLESQGREDEEYNDLVKDPVGWFTRNNGYNSTDGNPVPTHSAPVGFNPHQINHPASTIPPSTTVQPPPQAQQAQQTQNLGQQQSQQSQPPQQPQQVPAQTTSKLQSAQKPQQGQQSRAHSPPTSSSASSTSQAGFKTNGRASSNVMPMNNGHSTSSNANANSTPNAWTDKRRSSTTRGFQNLSISGNANSSSVDNSKVVVPYSPTNGGTNIHILQSGGRVLPPANPADQNPPCNTLYVGNLPPDTSEEELKELFSSRRGYKRLCFRTKANGPMCFVEFDDVSWATRALEELYGFGLTNSVKGGIRLSFSKNPLGVRSQSNNNNNSGNNNNNVSGNNNNAGTNNSNSSSSASNNGGHHNSHSRMGSQQTSVGMNGYSNNNNSRNAGFVNGNSNGNHQQQQQMNYNDSAQVGYMVNK